MLPRHDLALFTAVNAMLGFYLMQIGVLATIVCVFTVAQGNLWGWLFAPLAIGVFRFAEAPLRTLAAALRSHR